MTERPSGNLETDNELFRLRQEAVELKNTLALERKRGEERLQASEAFLETVIEHSPLSMWVSDHAGTLIRINQACRNLLRVTDEEVVGKYNLFKDNIVESQGAMPLVKRVFERGEQVRFTLHYDSSELQSMKLRETTQIFLEVTISPVLDTQGRVVHAIIQNLDVTERTQAEEAFRTSEERFKRLVQNSNDIIDVMDENCIQTSVFGPVEAILGYRPEEMVGTCGFDFVHPDDVEPAMKIFAEGVSQPGSSRRAEYRYRHKNGDWVALEAVGTNLLHDPVVKGIVVNVRDISERKRAEQERNRLQEQLQQAMKMEAVGRLAGGVAHDYNNMLGVILGRAEMALDTTDPGGPLFEALEEIRNAAMRSADLTRQLLAFARKQTISPKVLDLNETVEGMLKMLRRLIGEDIDQAWLPGRNLRPVRIDPSQLDQLMANLVVNARDAIKGVGKVTIETRNVTFDEAYCADYVGFLPGEYVMLAVSDDGCGMDKITLKHIFEPFFTTKDIGEGTGLGLATIYGIVKQNDGFNNVYSEPGKGTTFRIYLPPFVGDEARDKMEDLHNAVRGGTETILLVEDEEAILKLGKHMLERFGYTVLAASAPSKAIRIAEEHAGDIHLLLSDVVMPEMNGRELVTRLQNLYPDLKILFMSGYTANAIAHRGVLEEGIHFIQKPFSVRDLAARVRKAIEDK